MDVQVGRFVVKETSVWGDYHRAKNIENVRRLMKKLYVWQSPFVDHAKRYALKPADQRGSPRESQTFIVSYVYAGSDVLQTEASFITELASIHLRFHKEPCTFRGHSAYKIFIMDTDVDRNLALSLVPSA